MGRNSGVKRTTLETVSIQNFDRPGYTIECGLGENPLPLSQFESIWNANLGILTLAALGI